MKNVTKKTQTVNMSAYGDTHAGKIRENNEDYFWVNEEQGVFIVADGMGGHNAGEVASMNATEYVNAYFTPQRILLIKENGNRARDAMIQGMLEAHGKILDLAQSDPSYSGMGCTMVMGLVIGNDLHICHVGDARAYLSNVEGLTLVTLDHSRVMELVQAGHMTKEEARASPLKNELTQAIGGHVGIVPDYHHVTLKDHDKFLLCSDGLWDMLPDDRIQQILEGAADPRRACEELVEAANHAGGEDNITVVVVIHQDQKVTKTNTTVPLARVEDNLGNTSAKRCTWHPHFPFKLYGHWLLKRPLPQNLC